jgi:putative spermidine/putrescine transport system permease protein
MVRGRSWRERLGRLTFAGAVGLALTVILTPLVLVVWLSFFRNEILSLPPEGKAAGG